MVVFHKKSHRLALQRERVFSAVDAVATAGCSDPATPPAAISHEFCQGCDPAEGDLNLERAERKRQQLRSLASHVLSLSLPPSPKFVEFGSGSGHLGLLIASLRPDSSVVLVEIKQISCESAAARIASAGLTNCSIFHGSVDDFADSHSTFDVAIGLHLCGLLTDSVLELTTRRGALACIVPCCYGQLAGVENHDRGGGTAPRQWPRSTAYRAALGPEGMLDFEAVVKSADAVAVGRGGAFDADSPGFAVARRCMACVDADRLLWAREERGYSGRLAALAPLSCSPKNSVLLSSRRGVCSTCRMRSSSTYSSSLSLTAASAIVFFLCGASSLRCCVSCPRTSRLSRCAWARRCSKRARRSTRPPFGATSEIHAPHTMACLSSTVRSTPREAPSVCESLHS